MRVAYCVLRRGFALVRVIVLCAVLAACSSSDLASPSATAAPAKVMSPEQVLATTASTDCSGDAEPILVAPGWKVAWQKVFDNRIARPPVVDGSQMILVERSDARPATLKDTFLALDPQAGNLLWRVTDASNPVPYIARHMLSIKSSMKYWLLFIQYVNPDAQSTPPVVQYELVIDRQSGKVVFDSGLNVSGSASSLALTDEMLIDYYDGRGGVFAGPLLRRVDLPNGTPRWTNRWDARDSNGMFAINDSLLVFYQDGVHRYNALDGTLEITASLGIFPISNDVILQDNLAVARSQNLLDPTRTGLAVFDWQAFVQRWFVPVTYRYQQDSNAFWGDIPSITVTSDSVYLLDKQDNLLRLDLHTGEQLWQAASPGPQAMSRPVVMQDLVYALFADGTIRVFSVADGSPVGVVTRTPLWYRQSSDETRDFHDLIGGLGVADDMLIVTTGCRNVFALQREP
jgi:outer membrane protein assembly factor BamB